MINLIGPSRKKQFLAARRNSIWIRYVFILAGTSLAISLILGGTAFYFYGQKVEQDSKLETNQQKLEADKYRTAEKEVTAFRKNLKTASTVLDAETYYSVILTEIASTMPKNTIIGTIELSSSTFQGQLSLDFQAKTVEDAIALKTEFEKKHPLSDKVRFSQIDKGGDTSSPYPVKITMLMELKKPTGSTGAAQSSTTNTGVKQP